MDRRSTTQVFPAVAVAADAGIREDVRTNVALDAMADTLESPASPMPNDAGPAVTDGALESPASPPPTVPPQDAHCLICATGFEADTIRISCEVCSRSFCAECVELWRTARASNSGLGLNCPHCRTVIDVRGRRRAQPTVDLPWQGDFAHRRRNALAPPLALHPEQARRELNIWTRTVDERRNHDDVVSNLDETFQQIERLRIQVANSRSPPGFMLNLANVAREAGARARGNVPPQPEDPSERTQAPILPRQQFPPPLQVPQPASSQLGYSTPRVPILVREDRAGHATTVNSNTVPPPSTFESGSPAIPGRPDASTYRAAATPQPPPNAPREPAAMRAQLNQDHSNTAEPQQFNFFRRNLTANRRPNRAQLQSRNDAAQAQIRDMQILLDEYHRFNIEVHQYLRRYNEYEQLLNERISRLLRDNTELRSYLRNQADTIKDLQTIVAWDPIRAAIRAELRR